MIKNKQNTKHYFWNTTCEAWHLVNSKDLSVIQESMPPNTEEQLHKHQKTQQFFFILKGEAVLVLENKKMIVKQGEGFHVEKNKTHKIINATQKELSFLVISQPHSNNDRINIK
jgi:mannose-6-phosphate isomerase-like protein (cupin superfamily)